MIEEMYIFKRTRRHNLSWVGSRAFDNSLTEGGRYNGRIPLRHRGGRSVSDALVWADPPQKLLDRLKRTSQRIGKDTLRENAEAVLAFYERDIVEHVASTQVPTKELKHLLLRGNKPEPKEGMGKHVSRSSILGKDPFGEHSIPAELMKEGALTPTGSLLKAIQVSNLKYARVHLGRILQKDLEAKVRRREMEEEREQSSSSEEDEDSTSGSETEGDALKWKDYRETVLENLPRNQGVIEVGLLLSLEREPGEKALQWIQRIRGARRLMIRKSIAFPDGFYIKLADRQLTGAEKNEAAKAMLEELNKPVKRGVIGPLRGPRNLPNTASSAAAAVSRLSWDEYVQLTAKGISAQPTYEGHRMVKLKAYERVFTWAQAKREVARKPSRKDKRDDDKGKLKSHREGKLRKVPKPPKEESESKPRGEQSKKDCPICKKLGLVGTPHYRPHTRDRCFRRPGGPCEHLPKDAPWSVMKKALLEAKSKRRADKPGSGVVPAKRPKTREDRRVTLAETESSPSGSESEENEPRFDPWKLQRESRTRVQEPKKEADFQ